MAEIDGLLQIMTERGSSDLHVKVGSPPAIRFSGKLVVLHDLPSSNARADACARGWDDERNPALQLRQSRREPTSPIPCPASAGSG